jgi:hypothetical protein
MSSTEPKIYGATACHVSSLHSLDLLRRGCLQSVLEQTNRMDLFCVSWSAEAAVLQQTRDVFDLFQREFADRRISVKFLYQPDRCQQFQHYQNIHEFITSTPGFDDRSLIIFGDADDCWASDRVRWMQHFARQSHKDVVVASWYVGQYRGEQVWEVLDFTGDDATFEYWTAIIRFHVFTKFFRGLPNPHYLQSPYCDLAFATFLEKEDNERIKGAHHKTKKMYFYNGAQNAARSSMSEVELDLKFLEGQLMECYPDPLMRFHSYSSYFGFGLKPTVLKPITMAVLVTLKAKADTIPMAEYVGYSKFAD